MLKTLKKVTAKLNAVPLEEKPHTMNDSKQNSQTNVGLSYSGNKKPQTI
jgi:hypothetical protein